MAFEGSSGMIIGIALDSSDEIDERTLSMNRRSSLVLSDFNNGD